MSINRFNILIIVAIACIFQACKQSEPPEITIPERKGSLYFSGYYFNYKNTPNPVGPGPNRFKGTTDYAWVDANDKLHLKISKNPSNNFWYCSEIISVKQFGYGTYIMTCETDIRNFDAKTVFGCFTWDDYSFQKQGNSEVDIEFAKWGNDSDTLLVTYSAQPVIFSNPVAYNERTHKPLIATKYISKPMTYMMKWTPDSVFWESYEGETYPGTNKVSTWSFNKNNTPRQKIEGDRTSDFIVIPAPGDSTNLRFNFWLLNGQAPNNAQEHEIVIKNFKYIPL